MFSSLIFLLFTVTVAQEGNWSDCPHDVTVYEGCPYTIQHIFTAAFGYTCNDYGFSIEVNVKSYSPTDMPIDETNSCIVSSVIPIDNVVHNVLFLSSRLQSMETPNITCKDLLKVVNGNYFC